MSAALRRGFIALAAVAIAPITARAADLPVIRVYPPECASAPVGFDEFVDALRVELAGRQPHCCVVGPGGEAAADAVKVTLVIEPCDPATEQISVGVDVTAPPRTVQREVSLADLPPEARPRALALAVAELVRTASEPAQPVEVPAPKPDHPEETPAPLMLTGGVAGDVRYFFSHPTAMIGARLGLSLAYARLQVTLDVGAAATSSRQTMGDVSGDVSILLASASLFVGPRFALGPAVATFGPAASLGWASIKGRSDDPTVINGEGGRVVSTVGVRVGIEGPVPRVLRIFGYLEGGGTVLGVNADVAGQPAIGASGPYGLLAVGVRFGPS
jgi:hypothetical protein